MSKQNTEKVSKADLGNLKSQGFVLETSYHEGLKLIELWHHPCFETDKQNGICKHKAESGEWKAVEV